MPEELYQVSPKSHYVSLVLHSDPSPLILSASIQANKQHPFFFQVTSLTTIQATMTTHLATATATIASVKFFDNVIIIWENFERGNDLIAYCEENPADEHDAENIAMDVTILTGANNDPVCQRGDC